jgi:hypothetical protein
MLRHYVAENTFMKHRGLPPTATIHALLMQLDNLSRWKKLKKYEDG